MQLVNGNRTEYCLIQIADNNRYLYEREWYDVARNLVDVALETFEDKTTLAFASATDLSGLIDLDMNNSAKALIPFNSALSVRQGRLSPDDPLIASSLNNIALAYTEMEELDKAYATHQRAIDIRLRTQSDRIGNSYSNMSSLLLRMGKPEEAEEMLKRCPSLKYFTDETFLQTGNLDFLVTWSCYPVSASAKVVLTMPCA
jgi:tetratricopeptide (TPR) repeat protein